MKKIIVLLSTFSILFCGVASSFGQQAVSEEARRHMARGMAAVEMAKSPEEYGSAMREFQEASRLAPDWPDPQYNLGLVQEKSGKFREAVASLKEYLRLAPDAPDASNIKELIYKLEYKAENTLSTADIISVLTSLASDEGKGYRSPWQQKGNCLPLGFDWYISSKDEGYISVISLNNGFNYGKENRTYQVLKVDGPTVKFQWGVTMRSIIAEKYETQFDVLSKSRVKYKAVVLKGQPVLEGIRGPGMIFECELSLRQ